MPDQSKPWRLLDRIGIGWNTLNLAWQITTFVPGTLVVIGGYFKDIPWPLLIPIALITILISMVVVRMIASAFGSGETPRLSIEYSSPVARTLFGASQMAPDRLSESWSEWIKGASALIRVARDGNESRRFEETVGKAGDHEARGVAVQYLNALAASIDAEVVQTEESRSDQIEIDETPALYVEKDHYRYWQVVVKNNGEKTCRVGVKIVMSDPPFTGSTRAPLQLQVTGDPSADTALIPRGGTQTFEVCKDSFDNLITMMKIRPTHPSLDGLTVKQEYLWTIVAFTDNDGKDEKQFRLTLEEGFIKLQSA